MTNSVAATARRLRVFRVWLGGALLAVLSACSEDSGTAHSPTKSDGAVTAKDVAATSTDVSPNPDATDADDGPLDASPAADAELPDTVGPGEVVDGSDAQLLDAVLPQDVPDPSACPFPSSPAPGEPGSSCKVASDCFSGLCLDDLNGKVCSVSCVSCCPAGYTCAQVPAGPDLLFACRPNHTALCAPCKTDAFCDGLSPGARCNSLGDLGSFCATPCGDGTTCPDGYTCTAQPTAATSLCVPNSLSCGCSPAAVLLSAATQCAVSNAQGTCSGERSCQESGLTACSAPQPTTESCDKTDNDCDGEVDEEGAAGCQPWYVDVDSDGKGGGASKCLCGPFGVYVTSAAGDCNDTDDKVFPGASEICGGGDEDCDGQTDEGCDQDGDGWCPPGAVSCPKPGIDCNDADPAIHPGATETCGGGDEDCDGQTDEVGAQGCVVRYADADNDGYGDAADSACLCAATDSYPLTNKLDCNDQVTAINPAATETCGGGDEDCDGQTDEVGAQGCVVRYADGDNDGYGDAADSACLCAATDSYPLTNKLDCNDQVTAINPAATETCGGGDEDCDGQTDEVAAQGCVVRYADGDNDGYGDAADSACLCAATDSYPLTNKLDCNDQVTAINPAATETCGGGDEDCDGQTDEMGAQGCVVRYADGDGDGYGTGTGSCLCQPVGDDSALTAGDCDDANEDVNPAMQELCNGVDEDCDGVPDDGLPTLTYYPDADGDGYGTGSGIVRCAASGNEVLAGGDCNEDDPNISPDAAEVCANGVDENCISGPDEFAACPVCTLGLANGLEAFTDYTSAAGQWRLKSQPKRQGSNAMWWGDIDQLGYSSGSSLLRVPIPSLATGTLHLTVDVYLSNKTGALPDLYDDTLRVELVWNGIKHVVGPFTVEPATKWRTVRWAIPAGLWGGASSELQITARSTKSSITLYQGVAIDNIRTLSGAGCAVPDQLCPTSGTTTMQSWFLDQDNDGYGAADAFVSACVQPAGYVPNARDCAPTDPLSSPAASEKCLNLADDNCNLQVDETPCL